jgi:hypothetical protein
MATREMWRPIGEVRAACAEDEARRVKVRDMVERLRQGYRALGVDDPTREMVIEAMNRPADNGTVVWDVLADLAGHRPPSAVTRKLVLDHFPSC